MKAGAEGEAARGTARYNAAPCRGHCNARCNAVKRRCNDVDTTHPVGYGSARFGRRCNWPL